MRKARLVDTLDEPTTTELVGRAIMAPVLGGVGAVALGFLGILVGAIIGSGSTAGVIVFGALGGLLFGVGGQALGTALGGSLFSPDFGRQFKKTIGWALAATAAAALLGIVLALAFPNAIVLAYIAVSVPLAILVPLVVEWRRQADAPRAPDPAIPVASF